MKEKALYFVVYEIRGNEYKRQCTRFRIDCITLLLLKYKVVTNICNDTHGKNNKTLETKTIKLRYRMTEGWHNRDLIKRTCSCID